MAQASANTRLQRNEDTVPHVHSQALAHRGERGDWPKRILWPACGGHGGFCAPATVPAGPGGFKLRSAPEQGPGVSALLQPQVCRTRELLVTPRFGVRVFCQRSAPRALSRSRAGSSSSPRFSCQSDMRVHPRISVLSSSSVCAAIYRMRTEMTIVDINHRDHMTFSCMEK